MTGVPPGMGGAVDPEEPRDPGTAAATSQDERTWAAISHAGTILSAWLAMGVVVPLLVAVVKGRESAFVRRHAVESVNFQLTFVFAVVVALVLVLALIGIFLLLALGVLYLVLVTVATVKAARGEEFRYPLTVRLVK